MFLKEYQKRALDRAGGHCFWADDLIVDEEEWEQRLNALLAG